MLSRAAMCVGDEMRTLDRGKQLLRLMMRHHCRGTSSVDLGLDANKIRHIKAALAFAVP